MQITAAVGENQGDPWETAKIESNRNQFKSGVVLIKPLLQCVGIKLINYGINRIEAEMLGFGANHDVEFERIARLDWKRAETSENSDRYPLPNNALIHR